MRAQPADDVLISSRPPTPADAIAMLPDPVVVATLILLDRRLISGWAALLIWLSGTIQLTKTIADVCPFILVIFVVLGVAALRLLRPQDQAADGSDRVLPIQDAYSAE